MWVFESCFFRFFENLLAPSCSLLVHVTSIGCGVKCPLNTFCEAFFMTTIVITSHLDLFCRTDIMTGHSLEIIALFLSSSADLPKESEMMGRLMGRGIKRFNLVKEMTSP